MTAAERECAILSLRPKVEYLAESKVRQIFSIAVEDLVSAAWVGAIKAVDGFDPARGTLLSTYAEWKIRSAIADYLRSLDPLSRLHRQRIRSAGATGPFAVHLTEAFPREDGRATHDQRALEARLTVDALFARANLRPRDKQTVERHMAGETLREIGRSMGITEGRSSQINNAAITALRAAA